MDERRQLPRWQVKREVKVWLPQAQEFSHCVIEDLNMKGMCVSFNKRLPKKQPMKLSLALEDNFDFMKMEVHTPWVKEEDGRYVYGMTFSSILDKDKEILEKYINNRCSEQFKYKWWS